MNPDLVQDPITNEFFLSPTKKAEVIRDAIKLRPESRNVVLSKVNMPIKFEKVDYFYYVPRWKKKLEYNIGLFYGNWHKRNLIAKGIKGNDDPIASRLMTIDEVIDLWPRWRMYSFNYDNWTSLLNEELKLGVSVEFIEKLKLIQFKYPLK